MIGGERKYRKFTTSFVTSVRKVLSTNRHGLQWCKCETVKTALAFRLCGSFSYLVGIHLNVHEILVFAPPLQLTPEAIFSLQIPRYLLE